MFATIFLHRRIELQTYKKIKTLANKLLILPPKRTIHRATHATAFFVSATRIIVPALPQDADGDNDEGKDNQQHYDGCKIHAMMALAMR